MTSKSSKEVEEGLDKRITKVGNTYKFNFEGHDFEKISKIGKDHKHLLNHPVNEAYILPKWRKIRWILRANLWIYIAFLSLLTIFVQISYWKLLPNGKRCNKACKRCFKIPCLQKMSLNHKKCTVF
jgi:hypothetical protein